MRKPKLGLRRLKSVATGHLRPIAMPLILTLITLGLLGYRLLGLVPFGKTEQAIPLGSATLSAIKNDILLAPVKAAELFILKFTDDDIYLRLASVAVALVAALLLYSMLRRWYTVRVSMLTSLMFVTSSWFLHQGRLANTEVMYLVTVSALLVACMIFISKQNNKKLPIAAFMVGMALYTPGSWLFILLGMYALRKIIPRALSAITTKVKLISAATLLLSLVPLFYSFALRPGQGIRWLGFDVHQEFSVRTIATHFFEIPKQLFFTGPDDATRWLVGTPIFDVFTVAMVGLGLYAYHRGYYISRQKLLFGAIAIAVVLIGLGNVATISLLIPLLYLVVANGIAYMLQSWFTVFPRNPVARSIGVGLLVIVIAGSCFYQLHRYFVAWPQAENTSKALISER